MDLILTPAPENPAISADGRLLWRVFENLLSNIHKYAQPGTRVYLTCEAGENQVTITFRNISATPAEHLRRRADGAVCPGGCVPEHRGQRPGPVHRPEPDPAAARDLLPDHRRDLFKAALTFPAFPEQVRQKQLFKRESPWLETTTAI